MDLLARMRNVDIARMCGQVTLPDGLEWYQVGGQVVFPVYGVSGGLAAQSIAVLLDPEKLPNSGWDLGMGGLVDDERGHYFVIRFGPAESHHDVTAKFKEAFDAMRPNGN